MTRMLLPIACAVALAAAAPAAFAKGGDDGPGDDHGHDGAALVQKGHDDPPGDDHGAAAEPGDDKGQDAPAAAPAPAVSKGKKHVNARTRSKAGACTIRSTSKLKANAPRNGRIQVEFEVESHVSGQVWTVVLKDNGATFFQGNGTTKAPGGSFEAKASAKDQSGTDAISASATNPATGETCTASVSV